MAESEFIGRISTRGKQSSSTLIGHIGKGLIPDATKTVPASKQVRAGLTPPPTQYGLPQEKIPPGLPYWLAKGASGIVEQPLMGLAQLPFQVAKYFQQGARGTVEVSPFVDKAVNRLDPYKSGLITPATQETREYRDMYYYKKGKLRGHLNRIFETAGDFGAFISQIVLTKKFTPVGKFTQAGKAYKAYKTAAVGGKVAKGVRTAAYISQATRNASVLALHGAVTTPGTVEERGRAAVGRMLYALTPVATGFTGVANITKAGMNWWGPRTVDFLLNSALTSPQYKQMHDQTGGFNDDFWGMALPQITMDVAMSLSTAGFPEQRIEAFKTNYSKQVEKVWEANPKENNGKTLQENWESKDKYTEYRQNLIETLIDPAKTPDNVTVTETRTEGVEEVRQMDPETGKFKTVEIPTIVKDDAKSMQAKVKLKGMIGKGLIKVGDEKVNWEDLPPKVIDKLTYEISIMEEGQDMKQFITDFFQQKSNTIYWRGGDIFDSLRHPKQTPIWFRGRKSSFTKLANLMQRDKISMEQLEFSALRQGERHAKDSAEKMEQALRITIKDHEYIVAERFEQIKPADEAISIGDTRVADVSMQTIEKLGKIEKAPPSPQEKTPVVTVAERKPETKPQVPLRKGVVPRVDKPQDLWDTGKLNTNRRMSEKGLASVPVEDTTKKLWMLVPGSQKKAFSGAASNRKDGGRIFVNQKTLDTLYKMFQRGGKIFRGQVLWPFHAGELSREEFGRFAVEHERVHLATGLDGGKVDENMVNVIALERIGRADLAQVIEGMIPGKLKTPSGEKSDPAMSKFDRDEPRLIVQTVNKPEQAPVIDEKGYLEPGKDTEEIRGEYPITRGKKPTSKKQKLARKKVDREILDQIAYKKNKLKKNKVWHLGEYKPEKGMAELSETNLVIDAKDNLYDSVREFSSHRKLVQGEQLKQIEEFYQKEFDSIIKQAPEGDRDELNKFIQGVMGRIEKVEDLMGGTFEKDKPMSGKNIEHEDAPSVGPDGKDAQNFAFSLKMKNAIGRFFGHNTVKQDQVVQEFIGFNRVKKLNSLLGDVAEDTITRGVLEEIQRLRPDLSRPDKKKLMQLYLEVWPKAIEEIKHNDGDPINVHSWSEIGQKGPWESDFQRVATINAYKKLADALGKKYDEKALNAERPEGLFFKLIEDMPKIQGLMIWSKAQIEKPMLDEMIRMGILDSSDMFKSVQRGYSHRWAPRIEEQRGGRGAALPSTYVPGRKYSTYSEFEAEAKSKGLNVINDGSLLLSDYVRGSLDRIELQKTLNFFKDRPAPDDPEGIGLKMFEYKKNWPEKITGDDPNKFFTDRGYRKIHEAGLAEWYKNQYNTPWVHSSIFDTIKQINEKHQSWKAWNKINGFVKRTVMFSPNLFMIQIASTPFVWLPPGKAFKHVVKPLLTGEVFWKGLYEGRKMYSGQLKPFEHLQGKGYDPEKVSLFLRHGLQAFDSEWMMASFFDQTREKTGGHPLKKNNIDNLKDWIIGKCGIDRYAFNHYIAKNVYELTSQFYNKFLAGRKDPASKDEAARRAVGLTSDITGMVDSNIYGKEGPMLQGLSFARNFTMTFARQLTGALYPFLPKELYTYKTEGMGSVMNSLWHGEKSPADMQKLAPLYQQHLSRVIFWKLLLVNALQFGWSFLNDDEEERGKFAWDNEQGKKLMIKTPWKDDFDAPLYIDVLAMREATQLADLMGVPGYSRGAGQLLKNKMNFLVRQVIEQLSNADYMGQPITSPSSGVPLSQRTQDRMAYFAKGTVPGPARTDVRKPGGQLVATLLGAPMKRGRVLQAGWTWKQAKDLKDELARMRYDKQKIKKEKYLSNDLELMGLLYQGKISKEEYKNAIKYRAAPQTTILRRNRRQLGRRGFFK